MADAIKKRIEEIEAEVRARGSPLHGALLR
jgi:hypothetical protein